MASIKGCVLLVDVCMFWSFRKDSRAGDGGVGESQQRRGGLEEERGSGVGVEKRVEQWFQQ